jgi:hypothetical protein
MMGKLKSKTTNNKAGDHLEVVRGSGNVFRDVGREQPDVSQCKALLAAEIIRILDHEGLTVRAAHARTRITAADFSRIRNTDLNRFTVDRLNDNSQPSWLPRRSSNPGQKDQSGVTARSHRKLPSTTGYNFIFPFFSTT